MARLRQASHSRLRARRRPALPVCLVIMALATLSACGDGKEPPAGPVRPVRVLTVEEQSGGELVSITGQVQAEEEVSLGFRVGGRMIERSVNVGDTVEAGQVIARLEREPAENALRSARAAVAAARGQLDKTSADFGRQQSLLQSGFTTRVRYDQARQAMVAAQSQFEDARAQLDIATDNLDYTDLVVDAGGSVTARGAEPGEVVTPGQMIVRVAREHGRDAVFDVPERIIRMASADDPVDVALASDPTVRAVARVREVSPQADPVTRTFTVRAGIDDPPPAMRLGSTVVGSVHLNATPGISIPPSALAQSDGRAAVWVVDPQSLTVSLRPVQVQRFDLDSVIIAEGLQPGELIVTAGTQTLRPQQKVRLLGAPS
ncbi:MAG: efflux RND transporter periplasmic adaptor subunit [Rhodospirillales bacterium]|nr:efflux RND transporter periplasmic adaptor subunit [Rhodospirillales bacterium]